MNPIVNPLFQQQKDLWMSFVACSLLAAVVLPAGLLGELALFGARQPAAGQVSRAKGELISATDRLPLMQVGLDFHAVR
jgi:hypothetical protein